MGKALGDIGLFMLREIVADAVMLGLIGLQNAKLHVINLLNDGIMFLDLG